MMDDRGRKLPTPATAADMYACAGVEELRRLNANIERLIQLLTPVALAPGTVELREPESIPKRRRG